MLTETDEFRTEAAKSASPCASSVRARTNATTTQEAAPGVKKTRRKPADKEPMPEVQFGPRPKGRPPEYTAEYARMARRCMLAFGATIEELATFLDISTPTAKRWIDEHEDFRAAVKEGRERADAQVAEKLFQRACGYEHQAVKIFIHGGKPVVVAYVERFPPDTMACMYWLNNRRPDLFRNRRGGTDPVSALENVTSNAVSINVDSLSAEERNQLRQLLHRVLPPPDGGARPTARQVRQG
jgi:hypothetical protein